MAAPRAASMYASDNEGKGPLGPSNFDPAPGADETYKILKLQEKYIDTLNSLHDDQVLNTNDVEQDWQLAHRLWIDKYEDYMTEIQNTSMTDHLFFLRCLIMCCRNEGTRTMATLPDILQLYVELQVMGCNHTRVQFESRVDHHEVMQLERRCASLIVYHLSLSPADVMAELPPGALPPIDPVLRERMEKLKHVPDPDKRSGEPDDPHAAPPQVRNPENYSQTAEERLRQSMPMFYTDEDRARQEELNGDIEKADVNEGRYWHADRETVVLNFVTLASSIFRNYYLAYEIFNKYPQRHPDKCPVYPDQARNCMREWLVEKSKYDFTDSFVKNFRDLVYEHWLPVGARQVNLRALHTKYEQTNPLNLLESELGVDTTTHLAAMARKRVTLISIDPSHEVWEFLLLSQFDYLIRHQYGDTRILGDYYIPPSKIGRYFRRLDEKTTYGQPRRPIFTYLLHVWLIHDRGEWIVCKSAEDTLLKLMLLWEEEYECTLVSGIKFHSWVAELTRPKKIPQL